MKVRVLVVEDDPAIAELLAYTLSRAGYLPVLADSAERAMDAIRDVLPRLAVIDWMLPGRSGLWLVQKLRQEARTAQLPMIMVSAQVDESQRIAGLDQGADDYLPKPFSPRDLIARIGALLRCRAPECANDVLTVGPLRLDPEAHAVTVDGREVELRLVEFKLLRLLMAYPGRVFDRVQLLDRVWGDHVAIGERTIDVHMRRLRLALGAESREMLTTVRGGGYKLVAPETAEVGYA